ncbi:MAG: alpha/beta fold hydrolase [Sphingomonadaceae bacterium]
MIRAILALLLVAAPVQAAEDRPIRLPDGRILNLWCEGAQGPVILMESGWAADSRAWRRVIPLLAADHRVCAIDRSRPFRSAPGPLPFDAEASARDLVAAADAAGFEAPWILVGHSLGALVVRQVERLFPKRVAGLVLVDPTVPRQRQRLEALAGPGAGSVEGILARARECLEVTENGPAPVEGPLARCATSDPARARDRWAARVSELESLDEESSVGLDAPVSVPMIVLTAGRNRTGPALDLWVGLHRAEAARSARGEGRIVPDSGHLMILDRPDAIAEAVRDLSRR